MHTDTTTRHPAPAMLPVYGRNHPAASSPDEIWLPIYGFESLYEASNTGRIRSLCQCSGHLWPRGPRVMSQRRLAIHLGTTVRRDGRQFSMTGHKAVMLAFFGPPPPGGEVCHENGVGTDNRLANLRYDTHKSNVEDTLRHGRMSAGERHGSSRFSAEQVREIVVKFEAGQTQASLATEFGMSRCHVSSLVTGFRRRSETGIVRPVVDMHARRQRVPRGSAHVLAKLTEADVAAIYQSSEPTQTLALRYGVNKTVVMKIWHGKLWRHATIGLQLGRPPKRQYRPRSV